MELVGQCFPDNWIGEQRGISEDNARRQKVIHSVGGVAHAECLEYGRHGLFGVGSVGCGVWRVA